MILDMQTSAAVGYKSGCQITRRISEQWAAENLFCASCSNDSVNPAPANTKAIDFSCPRCNASYQLKASRIWNERRIPDAGYSAMISAIRSDRVPNLVVMQYSDAWQVQNLLLIPSFLFNESAIEKRKPLAPTARRAGWVGCNILLSAMPEHGKIRIVDFGIVAPYREVRSVYRRLKPLSSIAPTTRGWAVDVLKAVQSLGKEEFTLADVYTFGQHFQELHPDNRNVRPKIRQQLQVLRDLGMLQFQGRGRYRLFV